MKEFALSYYNTAGTTSCDLWTVKNEVMTCQKWLVMAYNCA